MTEALLSTTSLTNPCERFGIKHLSASHLNKAQASLAAWFVSYIEKYYEPTNAAMARGTCVEHGVGAALKAAAEDEFIDIGEFALEAAIKEFNKKTALGVDQEKRDKELKAIPGYVEQTLEAMKPYGTPSGYQEKISIELEGVPVPIIGYTDFTFDDVGKIPDLKTTGRLPSAIPAPHKRQGAIYQAAKSNHAIEFMYATPKKHAVYTLEPEDAKQSLEEVRQIAMRLVRFMDQFETKEEMAKVIIPDYDSFYFNGAGFRAKAREVFGY